MGTLYVVATPIGNLQDVTQRALAVLRAAALVLAEDTRHTRILLDRYGIAARPRSLHAHGPRRARARFDVIAVEPDAAGELRVRHLPGAFDASGC